MLRFGYGQVRGIPRSRRVRRGSFEEGRSRVSAAGLRPARRTLSEQRRHPDRVLDLRLTLSPLPQVHAVRADSQSSRVADTAVARIARRILPCVIDTACMAAVYDCYTRVSRSLRADDKVGRTRRLLSKRARARPLCGPRVRWLGGTGKGQAHRSARAGPGHAHVDRSKCPAKRCPPTACPAKRCT